MFSPLEQVLSFANRVTHIYPVAKTRVQFSPPLFWHSTEELTQDPGYCVPVIR